MKLIVGLGNPGQKYAGNRHNVGFLVLDRIAEDKSLGPWRSRFHGLAVDGNLDGERVLLLKPQTYYNEAGRAVREAAKFLKIDVGDVIVFHDEIDLAPGKLRVKTGGGHAGNNGLRSITSHLGPDFVRVRIGVGHPGDKNQVANYVLRDFAKVDHLWLDIALAAITRSISRLATGDTERFQTDVAQALSDMKQEDAPKQAPAASPIPQRRKNSGAAPSRAASGSPGRAQANPASAKRSGPNQLELAKKAARKSGKPSRRIKKGVKPANNDAVSAQPPSSTDDASSDTALADRLKRWLTGTPKTK